jgi:hypothetical protein
LNTTWSYLGIVITLAHDTLWLHARPWLAVLNPRRRDFPAERCQIRLRTDWPPEVPSDRHQEPNSLLDDAVLHKRRFNNGHRVVKCRKVTVV